MATRITSTIPTRRGVPQKWTRLRERLNGADRHAVQSALMPYEHLLPARFRGRNERIDEKLPMSTSRDSTTAPGSAIPPVPNAPRRMLHFHILRHDPQDPASVPHFDMFEIEEAAGMTLVHRAERDPREARPVARVRFRLPRRHLRQLRRWSSTAGPDSPAAR